MARLQRWFRDTGKRICSDASLEMKQLTTTTTARRPLAATSRIGARKPVAYFAFASSWSGLKWDLRNDPTHDPNAAKPRPDDDHGRFAVQVVPKILAACSGAPVMIGFDAGDVESDSECQKAMKLVKTAQGAAPDKVMLSIYVEGPGGHTFDTHKKPDGDTDDYDARNWLPDERVRIIDAALKFNVVAATKLKIVKKPNGEQALAVVSSGTAFNPNAVTDRKLFSNAIMEWDAGAWLRYTTKQLQGYFPAFVAAEIDNLPRAEPDIVAFYVKYASLFAASNVPSLIMKNIRKADFQLVLNAFNASLPRAIFADYHICEYDTKEPRDELNKKTERDELSKLSASIGIETLFSTDTECYRAHGPMNALAKAGFNRTMRAGVPTGGNVVVAASTGALKGIPPNALASSPIAATSPENSMALHFTIERSGRIFKARVDGGAAFAVGHQTTYTDKSTGEDFEGLFNVPTSDLPKVMYSANASRAQYGFWADFIAPTASCEGGNYLTLNTYDRARFTWGFGQFGAHVPDGDFILFMHDMLGRPEAATYFPNLRIKDSRIVKVVGDREIPLETSQSTAKLMDFLNPTTTAVEDAEVIAAAKLIHWTTNVKAARDLQDQHMVGVFKRLAREADTRLGLDGNTADICCVICDIRHQGRAKFAAMQAALASSKPLNELLKLGSISYPDRIKSLKKALSDAGPMLTSKVWDRRIGDFR